MRDNDIDDSGYLKRMKECSGTVDTETGHIMADEIMCELLEELGFTHLVIEFRKLKKWYA